MPAGMHAKGPCAPELTTLHPMGETAGRGPAIAGVSALPMAETIRGWLSITTQVQNLSMPTIANAVMPHDDRPGPVDCLDKKRPLGKLRAQTLTLQPPFMLLRHISPLLRRPCLGLGHHLRQEALNLDPRLPTPRSAAATPWKRRRRRALRRLLRAAPRPPRR